MLIPEADRSARIGADEVPLNDVTGSGRGVEDLLKEQADHSELQAEIAEAYLRVGQIYADLSLRGEAIMAVREAKARFESLSKANPTDATAQEGLAEALFLLGYNREAAAIWVKLLEAQPVNVRFRRELSNVYNRLALTESSSDSQAIDFHRKALDIREALVREAADDPEAHNDLGTTLNNIGILLDQEHDGESLAMFRQAAHHSEAAVQRAPHVILFTQTLSTAQKNMAVTERRLGRAAEALRSGQAALQVRRKVAADNPALPSLQADSWRHTGLSRCFIAIWGNRARPLRRCGWDVRRSRSCPTLPPMITTTWRASMPCAQSWLPSAAES